MWGRGVQLDPCQLSYICASAFPAKQGFKFRRQMAPVAWTDLAMSMALVEEFFLLETRMNLNAWNFIKKYVYFDYCSRPYFG